MYHEDWLRLSIKMSEMLKAHGLCKKVDLHIPGTMLGMGFFFRPIQTSRLSHSLRHAHDSV